MHANAERTEEPDAGTMLLDLAFEKAQHLDAKQAALRSLAHRYLIAARLTSRAPNSRGVLPPGEPPVPPLEQLEALASHIREKGQDADFSAQTLASLWRGLDRAFRSETEKVNSSIVRFLEGQNPAWTLVGQVCMNLAEAPSDAQKPLVLLWTYVAAISEDGKPQYRPLSEALQELGNPAQYPQLLGVLGPIYEASNRWPWLSASRESGGIFGVEPLSASQAYDLVEKESSLSSLGIALRAPKAWKGLSPVKPALTAVIGQNEASFLTAEALLDFNLAVTVGNEKLSTEEVEALLKSSDKLQFLRGRWVTVDQDNIERITKQLDRLKKAPSTGIRLPEATRMLASIGANEGEVVWEGVEAGPGLTQLLEDLRHPERLSKLKAPKGFNGSLRSYQMTGVQWLHFMAKVGLGACLADDMGLGKTIQVLALLLALKEENERGPKVPHLIVAPASVISNWEKELKQFTPSLKYKVLHSFGAADFRGTASEIALRLKKLDVVITTYGMLLELEGLRETQWNLVILDEAQAIKNPTTQQSKASKTLKAHSKIILTGTPVENHSTDLWSLFDFLDPGLLGSKREFHAFYKECAGRGDLSPLRTLVRPYILRRLKTDPEIGKYLPKKTEKDPIYCQLTPMQALLYQQQRDALALDLKAAAGMQRRGIVLKYITRFRQICNAPEHWQGASRWPEAHSGKLLELKKLARQCNKSNRKMLVFTAFAEAVRPLAAHLQEVFGTKGAILDGSIPTSARAAVWTRFQEDPSVKFFVLTLGTGGAGLNLSAASVVVHYDRWWNPAKERQATDRAHRFGQENDVEIYRLISKGTIEEHIDQLIASKQALFEELFEVDDPVRITEMSNEEILALVSLDLRQVAGGEPAPVQG